MSNTDRNGGRQPPNRNQDQGPRVEPVDPAAYGFPARPVADVDQVSEVVEAAIAQGLNVLAPVTHLSFLPPGYQVAVRIVRFPLDGEWKRNGQTESNGTWYTTDGGGLALHKSALRSLAAAAGASWTTDRTDDRTDASRWEFRASVRIRTMDGLWRTVEATKDLDLRDGSPVIESWRESARRKGRDGAEVRIVKAREVGGRVTEAKAVNAALRDALGIKGSYSQAEAARPFLFPILVYVPATPEALQLQAAVELGVVSQVYGPASRGKAYAPAGTVIDATAAEPAAPARPALPDHQGARDAPDFQAEARRLAERQRVERGPSAADEDPGFDPDAGWPEDEDGDGPPPDDRRGGPSSRQGPPADRGGPPRGGAPQGRGPVKCSDCGANVSDQVADYSSRRFGRVLCMDHQPRNQAGRR